MSFSLKTEQLVHRALELDWHLAPWDRASFGADTAAISRILIKDPNEAPEAFAAFRSWCQRERIALATCRLAQDRLVECGFLEGMGFRFIELIYSPVITDLTAVPEDATARVVPADPQDETEISGYAARLFRTGRIHADPQVGAEIGDRRYGSWFAQAFANPAQEVMKIYLDDLLTGFFVVETPTPDTRYWSIAGIVPGREGGGNGKRVWQAMLRLHRDEHVREIRTSMSSLNVPIFNLYARLGFRLPAPQITLHWCPNGPLRPMS